MENINAGDREVIVVHNPYTLYTAVTHRVHTRLAEWHLAIAMTLAGLVLLADGNTFALDPYIIIRGMASEAVWAWVLLGVGTIRIMALTINGALPRGSPHLRAFLSWASAVVWSILFTGFLFSEVPSLMIAVTGAAIVTEMINIVRAAGSARIEDEKIKGRKNGRSG